MATTELTSPAVSPFGYRFPDGPKPKPYIGSTLEMAHAPLEYLTALHARFGKASTIEFLKGARFVVFFTPAAVKYVLTEHPRNFTSREFNDGLRWLLGEGLLVLDGETHRRERRLVQPAFHKKRIEQYASIMTEHTDEALAGWRDGETRDIALDLQNLTMRIVAKALFDADMTASSMALSQAFNTIARWSSDDPFAIQNLVKVDLPFLPYGKIMGAARSLNDAMFALIQERRAHRADRGDVLSMLLAAQDEDGSGMSDRQVRDEVMTLFAAGHETTMNALCWTFYLLSEYPSVRRKLEEELTRVLEGRAPTVEDVPNLVYTDMVIKEAMRLYPPAWTIGRRAVADFEVEGFVLPAGQFIFLPQWVVHRSQEVWGVDAQVFRPERFDPEHPQEVPPFAYFPFGGGPRICIGMPFAQMEARLLLAMIAQRFRLRVRPGFRVVPKPGVTIRPKYGLQMTLEAV